MCWRDLGSDVNGPVQGSSGRRMLPPMVMSERPYGASSSRPRMLDPVSLSIGLAALVAAGIAGYGVYVQRGQLRAAEGQLRAALEQLKTEEAKVDALGKLVQALSSMVDLQRRQLEAFSQAVRVQQDAVDVARTDAAINAARLQLEQANPIDKAGHAIREVLDRGVANARSWWDRHIRRRR
jgi:hypothetical protein